MEEVTVMPRGDRTGPMGMGSMTGRRVGFCAGFAAPGYMNSVPGYEIGSGRGCGFSYVLSYRHADGPVISCISISHMETLIYPADEKEILTT